MAVAADYSVRGREQSEPIKHVGPEFSFWLSALAGLSPETGATLLFYYIFGVLRQLRIIRPWI